MSIPGTINFPGSLDDGVSLFETANRISTTLNGGINNVATTLTLFSGTGWPNTGSISFNDTGEIAYYTGKTGDQLTGLLRGQDGTAAAAHNSGVTVQLNDTSRHHQVQSEAIIAAQAKIGVGASAPASGLYLRGSSAGVSAWASIAAGDLPTGIDASKINTGVVSNAEFNCLDGVTSSIQTQLNAKQASGSYAVTTNNLSDLANAATARTNLGLGTLATQNGTFSGTSSGTNTGDQTFNGLSPMSALGDIIYGAAAGAGTRLAGNITTTRQFLRQVGTGSVSAAPAWDTVTKADVGLSSVENTALSTWAGSTNIVTLGTITTGTWQGTAVSVAKGGTGKTSFTAYGVICAGTTSTNVLQQVSGTGTAGQALVSNGPNALPSWQTLSGGSGMPDPMTTAGDIIIRNISNTTTRLGIGSTGHVLTVVGGVPAWAAAGSGSGDVVGPASATDNAIVRFDTTTGKLIQDSVVTIDDATGAITGLKDKGGQVFNVKAYGATGDGTTDDLTAIQAANTAAAAVKGIVYLPPGTYAISNTFTPSTGVTVRGSGRASTFLKARTGFNGGAAGSTILSFTSCDHIIVEHIGFISNSQTVQGFLINTSTNCRISHCHFDSGLDRMGIVLGTTTKNIVISYNVSDGSVLAENLALDNLSYSQIIGNHIKKAGVTTWNCIELAQSTVGYCVGNRIEGNTCEGSTGNAGIWDGGGQGTVIANNVIRACSTGILLSTFTADPSRSVTIIGNTVEAPIAVGISVETNDVNCTITGNTIRNSTGQGINVQGSRNTVTSNTIYNSTGIGLVLGGSYCTVQGNQVLNNSRGMEIAGDKNTVVGNTATDTRGTAIQDYGLIFISGADDNIYAGNSLSGNLTAEVLDSGLRNAFFANLIASTSASIGTLTLKGTTASAPTGSIVALAPGDDANKVLIGTATEDSTGARVQIKQRTGGYTVMNVRDSDNNDRFKINSTLGFDLIAPPATAGATVQSSGILGLHRHYWNGSTSVDDGFYLVNTPFSAASGEGALILQNRTATAIMAWGDDGRGNGISIGDNIAYAPYGQLSVKTMTTTNPTLGLRKLTSQTSNLFQVVDTDDTTVKAKIDSSFNLTVAGTITAGSGPTTLTSSVGKLLIAAIDATGTPSGSNFLRGDGTWSTPAGAGTVTHTAGALTANAVVIGNGTDDIKVLASLGSSGDVLTSNGAGVPPSFQAPTGGGAPGGSGSELQFRGGASTFSAVTGSSVSGAEVTLAGKAAINHTSTVTTEEYGFSSTFTPNGASNAPHAAIRGTFADGYGNNSIIIGVKGEMLSAGGGIAIGVYGIANKNSATGYRVGVTGWGTSQNGVGAGLAVGGDFVGGRGGTGSATYSFGVRGSTDLNSTTSIGGWFLSTNSTGANFSAANNGPAGDNPPQVQVPLVAQATDAGTSTVSVASVYTHDSSGTPANGFGVSEKFLLHSSTTRHQDAASIAAVWTDVTHATRTADLVFSTVNNAAALAEGMRLRADGMLAFQHTKGVMVPAGSNLYVGTGASGGGLTFFGSAGYITSDYYLRPTGASTDLGAAAASWRDLYLYGSGTFGSTSLKLTGTPTGNRVITLPDSNTTVPIASQQLTLAGATAARTYTFPDASVNVGTLEILQNSQSAAYTLVLADSGKHIYHPSADTVARTWTIPANASVAFPVGTAITFVNDTSAGTITIAITTDTLVLAGAGTTGSRTLAANGVATAVKVTSTRWIISGTNLT